MARKRKPTVRRPYERIKRTVSNHGDERALRQIKGVALHTTEGHDRPGISDLAGLGDYFDLSSTDASSSVAVDGEGLSARFLPDSLEPWTQRAYNPYMLSIEMIGFAKFKRWQWVRRNKQLIKVAQYIAYWSERHDIPIRRGRCAGGIVTRTGVFTHKQFGVAGGGHVDPGPGFPIYRVMKLARKLKRSGW